MTDKEKAEKYVRTIHHDVNNWGGKEPTERFYDEVKFKQAYLDGLTEGKKEGYEQGKKDYITNDRSYVIPTKEMSYVEIAKENAKLKAQIEKMKCCENCKWYKDNDCIGDIVCTDNDWNGWELAE